MIGIYLKYEASLFSDFEDVKPTPDVITSLITLFRDKKLIPSTFTEIEKAIIHTKPRLQMMTEGGEWIVRFGRNRVLVTKSPTDLNGSNMGPLDDYCEEVIEYFRRIFSEFDIQAKRLALVTNYYLREMTEEELSAIYYRLFNPPEFYRENNPIEWDWRTVSKIPFAIGEMDEIINSILILNRRQGDITTKDDVVPFDRIELSQDINTIASNNVYRFGIEEMARYFEQVKGFHNTRLQEIQDYINE